jgi:hypothetical protein
MLLPSQLARVPDPALLVNALYLDVNSHSMAEAQITISLIRFHMGGEAS